MTRRRVLPSRLVPLQPAFDLLAELLCEATLDAARMKPRRAVRIPLLRRPATKKEEASCSTNFPDA